MKNVIAYSLTARTGRGSSVVSVSASCASGPETDRPIRHILSSLPLILDEQDANYWKSDVH